MSPTSNLSALVVPQLDKCRPAPDSRQQRGADCRLIVISRHIGSDAPLLAAGAGDGSAYSD